MDEGKEEREGENGEGEELKLSPFPPLLLGWEVVEGVLSYVMVPMEEGERRGVEVTPLSVEAVRAGEEVGGFGVKVPSPGVEVKDGTKGVGVGRKGEGVMRKGVREGEDEEDMCPEVVAVGGAIEREGKGVGVNPPLPVAPPPPHCCCGDREGEAVAPPLPVAPPPPPLC